MINTYLKFTLFFTALVTATIVAVSFLGVPDTYLQTLNDFASHLAATIIYATATVINAFFIIVGVGACVYSWFKMRESYRDLKKAIRQKKANINKNGCEQ